MAMAAALITVVAISVLNYMRPAKGLPAVATLPHSRIASSVTSKSWVRSIAEVAWEASAVTASWGTCGLWCANPITLSMWWAGGPAMNVGCFAVCEGSVFIAAKLGTVATGYLW